MSRPTPQPDRAKLLEEFDRWSERHPKPAYTKPVVTSADKLAVLHRDYYENSAGNRVTPYSLPVSLC